MLSPKTAPPGNGGEVPKVTALKGTALTGVYKYRLLTIGLLTSQSHSTAPDQLLPLCGANLVGARAGIPGNLGNHGRHGSSSVPALCRVSNGPARYS